MKHKHLKIIFVSLLMLTSVSIANAGLNGGYYTMKYPGIECRENRSRDWESRGRYSENGQGYELKERYESFRATCPLWYVDQINIAKNQWVFGTAFGALEDTLVYMDVIDNNGAEDFSCYLVFSDSLDWDENGWADWSTSSVRETNGTGSERLVWELADEGLMARDVFITIQCEVPPCNNGDRSESSKIAGYQMINIHTPRNGY